MADLSSGNWWYFLLAHIRTNSKLPEMPALVKRWDEVASSKSGRNGVVFERFQLRQSTSYADGPFYKAGIRLGTFSRFGLQHGYFTAFATVTVLRRWGKGSRRDCGRL